MAEGRDRARGAGAWTQHFINYSHRNSAARTQTADIKASMAGLVESAALERVTTITIRGGRSPSNP